MGGTGQSWRVLVVDDEENLNWSLVTSLRRDRYEADGALSAEAAIQRMTELPYDCVISDVKMPGMDGFELLQWLRQHRPSTRVIMMTAFGSPTARQAAQQGGVVAYLEKPFDLRVLKEELRRLAGSAAPAVEPTPTEGYDLLDVVQVLHLTRRDIAIRVENPTVTGILRFAHGELIAAEAGELRGEAAFLALAVPRAARVEPEPWDGFAERTVTEPISRLVFQALAQRERRTSGAPAGQIGTPSGTPTATGSPSGAPSAPAPSVGVPEMETMVTSAMPAAGSSVALPTGERISGVPATSPASEAPAAKGPTPSAPPANEALAEVIRAMAQACPVPCGIALLRPDGVLLGQEQQGITGFPPGTYLHLAAAAQAALRALLVADWGMLEELRVTAAQATLVVRRLASGERAVLCAVALPRDADPAVVEHLLREHEADVLAALR
jgi:CheY-like chemotaxis protein